MAITRFLFRTNIQERIVGFSHHMRDNGVTTTPLEVHSTLRLLRLIDITNIEEVRLALKSVFTNNKESFARFNELFDAYWLNDGVQIFPPTVSRYGVSSSASVQFDTRYFCQCCVHKTGCAILKDVFDYCLAQKQAQDT